jgi:hypothetical protein
MSVSLDLCLKPSSLETYHRSLPRTVRFTTNRSGLGIGARMYELRSVQGSDYAPPCRS